MNNEMAYLIGMILGNGEVQRGTQDTTVTIDIPHKNLLTDDGKDVEIYVKASLMDIIPFWEQKSTIPLPENPQSYPSPRVILIMP